MIFLKALYIVIFFALFYLFIGNQTNEDIVIPDESIRFRIIANSNDNHDQSVKLKVKDNLETYISSILMNANDIVTVERIIEDNLTNLSDNVKKTLIEENYLKDFNISYGKNYFPEKDFYGVKYNKGEYESLVVTIGEGLGNNWWCVLFPPLCLVEAEESTETEYRIYVKDVLDKYL